MNSERPIEPTRDVELGPSETLPDGSTPAEKGLLLRPGTVVAGYFEVVRSLGSGSMGAVYEAVDRALDRHVAIKVPRPGPGVARIHQEAQALAGLQHPNLVTVHALAFEGELPVLVMELIQGSSLADLIEERGRAPFGANDVVEVLDRVANALHVIHDAGLVHRDVKPANIILAGRRPVLMDLGLVQRGEGSGAVFGTPAYMAPEVVLSSVSRGMGALVDIYALGVTAFELLTGDLPFKGNAMHEVLMRHVTDAPPDLRALRPGLPQALVSLVQSMMAKEPSERPVDATEVSWQLSEVRWALRNRHMTDSPTVLIVDDEPEMRELVSVWIGLWYPEWKVVTAESGRAALDRFAQIQPTLMIVDLRMPDMNGFELCRVLQGTALAGQVPTIAMSARADEEDARRLHELGVTCVLAKGQTLEHELHAEIQRLLDSGSREELRR